MIYSLIEVLFLLNLLRRFVLFRKRAGVLPTVLTRGDKEETIRNRLKVYRENTFPLIDYYEKKGKLVTIKGDEGTIDDVFAKVEKALKD